VNTALPVPQEVDHPVVAHWSIETGLKFIRRKTTL
jgi:hypothetical protein